MNDDRFTYLMEKKVQDMTDKEKTELLIELRAQYFSKL